MCVNIAWPQDVAGPVVCPPASPDVGLRTAAVGPALNQDAATRLAALLGVLAEPARLRILSLLQAQPSREACVRHVTDFLGLSQPAASHHLRVLFDAGLVERERRGNGVYYCLAAGTLDGLSAALGSADAAAGRSGNCSDACACR